MQNVPVRVAACLLALAAAMGAQAASPAPAVFGPLAQAQDGPGMENPAAPGNEEGRRRRGPPPEAVAACQNKVAGAACSFTNHRNETRTGTCFAPPPAASNSPGAPAQPPLACRPQRPQGERAPG